MKRTLSIVLRIIALALILFFAWAGAIPVQAHAELERSDPPNNAVLTQAPSQIRMWFSESVAIKFSSVRMLDINGQVVNGLSLALDPRDPRLVVVSLPKLAQGVYSLSWMILSGSDGHDTQGLLVFGINQTPTGSGVASTSSIPDPLQVGARALLDIALCGLFGTLAVTLALLTRAVDPGDDTYQAGSANYHRRAVLWSLVLAGLSILAGLLQWILQVTSSAEGNLAVIDWGSALALLFSTSWGQFWLFRQFLLIVTCVVLLARWHGLTVSRLRLDWFAAAILAAGALLAYAFSTHAAGLNTPFLPLLSDILHLLSAGMWVGGLIALLVILLPVLRRAPGARAFFESTWGNFGRFAVIAVGLTLATGLYNTAGLVVSSSALTESAYGQTLELKVGFVLLVGLIGLANSLVLHPRLSAALKRLLRLSGDWNALDRQHLPYTIAVEAVLGLAVFVLAGLLASNSPANSPEYRYGGIEQPELLTQNIDDLLVSLTVLPNVPGENIIEIHTDSTRRPPPAEILKVILRVTYLGEPLGTQSADATLVEPGLYRLGGSYLSLPGPWKMDVVVRRKGVPDSNSIFTWNVVPIVSAPFGLNFSLQTPLEIGTGLLLLITLGLAIRFFYSRAGGPGPSGYPEPFPPVLSSTRHNSDASDAELLQPIPRHPKHM